MANESDNGLTRKGKNTDRELPECPKVYHLSESPGHILFFPKCGRSEDPALLVLRKGLGRFLVISKRKIQSKSTLFFSLFLTIILAPFPAGLVIYWTVNNILTMAQQVFIMKRTTVKTTT